MVKLGEVSFGALKFGELCTLSFGTSKLGKLGEVNFGTLKFDELSKLSFGTLKLVELGELWNFQLNTYLQFRAVHKTATKSLSSINCSN